MNQSDIKAINELKVLSIDMINGAKSGNPGIVLDMAPVMYTLFARVLNVYPKNPTFFNRDRVVLSSAHISPLYYSALHMAGFNISKSDLEHFRRLDSNTPGLPELNNPLGVDASTGYAGDGIGISVGICMARRYLANMILNEDKKLNLLDFTTYCFLSDADIMSGSADEAFSFAIAQNLNNLVFLYDANNMNSEGPLDDVLPGGIEKKFMAMGFYVDSLKNTENVKEIARAIEAGKNSGKPAIIIFKNVIGKDSFNMGKNIIHSGPLSMDDTANLRRKYNLFLPPFEISKDSMIHLGNQIEQRTNKILKKWNDLYSRAKNINSDSLNSILTLLETGNCNISFIASNYKINDGYRESLIDSNYKVLNLINPKSPFFLGGSASEYVTSKTMLGGENYQSSKNPLEKNIRFGTRERAMAHILNGMSLMGLRVFGSTKLCFLNECLSGLKMSAMMGLPVTYIFTHDSLYFSEEGPARIPNNELTILRTIPNMITYRPADIYELMGCYENILNKSVPSSLVITRNSVPKLPGSNYAGVSNGGYIIKKEVSKLDGIIVSSGSEVVSSMQIAYDLYQKGLDIRVVSMPSLNIFLNMDKAYQETVLPSSVKTIVIEASSGLIWNRIASSPDMILSIDDFAYGGVPIEVLSKMEFDYDSLKLKVESLLN